MTTKQIASICGVTEQSIRNWCKKNNIVKTKQSPNTRTAYLIDIDVEKQIFSYYHIINENLQEHHPEVEIVSQVKQDKYSQERKISNNEQQKQANESKETKEKQEKNVLQNELIKQLQEKDKQITMLQEQNKLLIESNQILTKALNTTQQSLQAEQTLHAATIQTQALVDNSTDIQLKWWKRIFKKNE